MLEQYGHGGDLLTAAQRYGRAPDDFIDFSSNMNPWGPPKCVQSTLQDNWMQITRYPDPTSRRLKEKISRHYGISVESIGVGNGAAELIDLVIRVLKPARTGLFRPSFSEYEEAVVKAGGAVMDIPLHSEHQFQLQRNDWESVKGKADAFFFGNPNNPTGQLIPSDLLAEALSGDQPVILDEAFMDFLVNEDQVSRIHEAPLLKNLFVIRSMTKFYAIPGIRLGFIVAHPDWIQKIEALQVPWSVNFLAQRIGEKVLDDAEFTARSKSWLEKERSWFCSQLTACGLTVTPSEVNYVLVSLPGSWTAMAFQQEMGRRGFLIRNAALLPGLSEKYCRLAIKRREDNEKLIQEMKQVLK